MCCHLSQYWPWLFYSLVYATNNFYLEFIKVEGAFTVFLFHFKTDMINEAPVCIEKAYEFRFYI